MQFKKFLVGVIVAVLMFTVLSGTVANATDAADLNIPDASVSTVVVKSPVNGEGADFKDSGKETGGQVNVSVSDVTIPSGQEVKVELSMTGKNIVSFEGTLVYDTQALKIVNVKGTDLLSDSGIASFNQSESSKEFLSGRFVYASPIGKDMDGAVLEFTFKALDKVGKYDFSLKDLFVFEDADNGPAKCKTEITNPGSITVSESVGGGNSGGFNVILLIAILVVVVVAIVAAILIIKNKKSKRRYS